MSPDDVIVSSAFCPLPWMPVALPPVVMMSAVDLIVTVPPLLAAKMPFGVGGADRERAGVDVEFHRAVAGENDAVNARRRRDVGRQVA